jgi:regulator of protease activity HflC (stomatin/prohibitin superfamily)
MLANARGHAQAVRNKASGESRTIREVAKALRSAGETNPTKYLLSVKYLEAVKKISGLPGTAIKYVPKNVSDGVSEPGGGAQSVAMGVGLMLGKSFGQ